MLSFNFRRAVSGFFFYHCDCQYQCHGDECQHWHCILCLKNPDDSVIKISALLAATSCSLNNIHYISMSNISLLLHVGSIQSLNNVIIYCPTL